MTTPTTASDSPNPNNSPIADLDAKTKRKESRKVILSSYLGSTIEYYDFLLYASASALVFPHVFFTGLDPLAGAIASYGTFAAGYLARPLGGAVFGHFGDKLGRKKMLVLSMLIMGVASTLIGLVPSADSIGSWGAVILVMLRVCQGIAVGGEWGGAALMALEHSETKSRGFAASFANAGAPTGAALGTFVLGTFSAILPQDQFLSWGWRIPFILSFVLLIIGMVVRAKISESPIFLAALAEEEAKEKTSPAKEKKKLPIIEVLRHPKPLLLTMFAGASGFGLQVLLSTFAVQYATDHGANNSDVLYGFAIASIVSIFCVVGFAKMSDMYGRRPVMIVGLILFAAYLPLFFMMLETNNWWIILAAFVVALMLHGMVFGPLAAFVSEQFGTGSRYTGASMGYQLATLLGAGFTPTIISSLYANTGGTSVTPVILYLVFLVIVSIAAILMTRETKDLDLEDTKVQAENQEMAKQ